MNITDEDLDAIGSAVARIMLAELHDGGAHIAFIKPIPAEWIERRDAGEIEIGRRLSDGEPMIVSYRVLDNRRTRFEIDGEEFISEVDTAGMPDPNKFRWAKDNEFLREHGVALVG